MSKIRWITDQRAAQIASQLGLSLQDFAGVINDANVLWRFIAGHEWVDESTLRTWAGAQADAMGPDRANRALSLLRILRRAYQFDDSPILPPPPGDTSPPVVSAARVMGTSLTITFSEHLTARPVGSAAFKVRDSTTGEELTPSVATVAGDGVTLTLPTSVAIGATVSVDYTAPASGGISDLSGNEAASFNQFPVLNNTTATSVLSTATKETLLEHAKHLGIEGRSSMNVEELRSAVASAVDAGATLE